MKRTFTIKSLVLTALLIFSSQIGHTQEIVKIWDLENLDNSCAVEHRIFWASCLFGNFMDCAVEPGRIMYADPGFKFIEFDDNTAQMIGTMTHESDSMLQFAVDITLTGRTISPPVGSPKVEDCAVGESTADWFYYTTTDGTLTGLKNLAGGKLTLYRYGPAFQFGTHGSLKTTGLGGSGWLDYTIDSQPTTGPQFNDGNIVDFNIDLTINTDCNAISDGGIIGNDTVTCSGSLYRPLVSNIQLPTASSGVIEYAWQYKYASTGVWYDYTLNSPSWQWNSVLVGSTEVRRLARVVGCGDSSWVYSNTINWIIDYYPDINATVDGQLTCTNSFAVLNVISDEVDLSYSWIGPNSFASSSANPVVTEQGIYTVTVTNSNGCGATDIVVVEDYCIDPPPCAVACTPTTLVEWDMENCVTGSESSIFTEFTPNYPNTGGCTAVEGTYIHRKNLDQNTHSCAIGPGGVGVGICTNADTSSVFIDGSNSSIRFSVILTPTDAAHLSSLSFYEMAPDTNRFSNGGVVVNNYPQKYAITVRSGGNVIYQESDIATTQNWTLETFDFSNDPDFAVTGTRIFNFELVAYDLIGVSSAYRAWDLDQIQIDGCCGIEPDINTNISAIDTSCVSTGVLFEADTIISGATYAWSFDGGATPDTSNNPSEIISWSTPGTKTATLTVTLDSCSQLFTKDIIVKDTPEIATSGDITICAGDSAVLHVFPSGSKPILGPIYTWNDSANSVNDSIIVSPSNTTIYIVNVTDAYGCQATDSVTVTVVDSINSGINGPDTRCAMEGVLFAADPPIIGAIYSWTFSDDANPSSSSNPSETVVWNTPGTKLVTLVIASGGCTETYTHEIIITDPVFADAGPNGEICQGDSYTLGGSPTGPSAATFKWTPNLFLSSDTVANPVATPPIPITYTLVVTQNGCVSSAQVDVMVDVYLKPVVEAGPDKTIIIGDTVTVGSIADSIVVQYQWSDINGDILGADSNYYESSPDSTVMYYLTGTNAAGCEHTDSVRITVIPPREICNNGIDDDKDGLTDCDDDDCDFVPGCSANINHTDPSIVPQTFDKWIFGDSTTLDFSNGLPETNNNARMIAQESSISFSGPNGNLLFYSNGSTIYDANHNQMEDGDDIGGTDGVINSSVSFQDPKLDERMYLFVTANDNDGGGNPHTLTANYSLIKMTENGGLGKVMSKNQAISGNSEGLTAIPHANGRDFWVITSDINTATVYTTLVDQLGVQTSVAYSLPVVSGALFPQQVNIIGNGQQDKIAIGSYLDNRLSLLDFNNVTGVISNRIDVDLEEKVYGIEFSPNGMYVFVSSYLDSTLIQLQINDVPATERSYSSLRAPLSAAAILASKVIVSEGAGKYGHLQIGPDGRIYCPIAGVSMGAILNPNGSGINAGWDGNILNISGARITGALPNHMWGGCFRTQFLLPVELSYFDVSIIRENDVQLLWGTESEINNDYFSIERSDNAIEWQEIGIVEGNGTVNHSVNYDYIDPNLSHGLYYYRLKQIDYDGSYEYSNVQSIYINANDNTHSNKLIVYPNPISQSGIVNLVGINSEDALIEIITSDGKLLTKMRYQKQIDLARFELETGLYIIRINDGFNLYQKTIIITK